MNFVEDLEYMHFKIFLHQNRYIFKLERQSKREGDKENSPICWFIPQVFAIATRAR